MTLRSVHDTLMEKTYMAKKKASTPKTPKVKKAASPKAEIVEPVEVVKPQPAQQERKVFRSFEEYVRDYPEAELFRNRLSWNVYPIYLIFPLDPEKHTHQLPGGYLWANVSGFEHGTLNEQSPHWWIYITDTESVSMRKWFYSEVEAKNNLEELAILLPSSIHELEQMGYKAEKD
jgi:hypothetical protein